MNLCVSVPLCEIWIQYVPSTTTNVTTYPLLSCGTNITRYVWGLDISGQSGGRASSQAEMQGAGGVGDLCAVFSPLWANPRLLRIHPLWKGGWGGGGADGGLFYPCYDANGQQKSAKGKVPRRPTAILRLARKSAGARARSGIPRHSGNCHITEYVDTNGVVVAHYEYDAFGNTVSQIGSMADDFNHRFSTKYLDVETGLYDYIKRPYSPKLQRFISRDPIGERGGLNLYGFCGNDPINSYDYLGMWKSGGTIDDRARRIYIKEKGDSFEGLAKKVGLDINEIHRWAKFVEESNSCKVSVPNIWIDADFLRGGGLYDRIVNLGGTIGSVIGTDIGVSGSRKVVTVKTVNDLIAALGSHTGNLWGMTVYGHGSVYAEPSKNFVGPPYQLEKPGMPDGGVGSNSAGWTTQMTLINAVRANGYKVAEVNMMQ